MFNKGKLDNSLLSAFLKDKEEIEKTFKAGHVSAHERNTIKSQRYNFPKFLVHRKERIRICKMTSRLFVPFRCGRAGCAGLVLQMHCVLKHFLAGTFWSLSGTTLFIDSCLDFRNKWSSWKSFRRKTPSPATQSINRAAALAFFTIWSTVWDDISSMSGKFLLSFQERKRERGGEKREKEKIIPIYNTKCMKWNICLPERADELCSPQAAGVCQACVYIADCCKFSRWWHEIDLLKYLIQIF